MGNGPWQKLNPNIPTKPEANPDPVGMLSIIERKHQRLKESGLDLGEAAGEERVSADNSMRYRAFQRGGIAWKKGLGVFEVHDDIFVKWTSLPGGFDAA